MKRILLLAVTLLALLPVSREAQTVNEFRGFSEPERGMWISGFTQGLAVASRSPDAVVARVMACVFGGWTANQARAVFDKYANEHPEDWHLGTLDVLMDALLEACEEESNESAPSPPDLEGRN